MSKQIIEKDLPKIDPKLALWMDDCIKRLYSLQVSPQNNITKTFALQEITAILRLIDRILLEECSLLEIAAPVKIIGDLHGDFSNFQKILELVGKPPKDTLLFLGNYVDIGMFGIEIMILLICLKIRHPQKIYLLRGNHEISAVNKIYGFYNECESKYGIGLWWDFQCTFNRLPMACLVSKKIFCVHGGLSPDLISLDKIRKIERPFEPLNAGLEMDLLWSDPTNRGDGWYQSFRGISYVFGKGVVEEACKILGISMIIRSHMIVPDGYEVMTGRRLITVFSIQNFTETKNNAAVLCVNTKLEISHQKLVGSLLAAAGAPAMSSDLDVNVAKADRDFVKPFVKF